MPPLLKPGAGDSANWPLLRSVKQIFEKSTFENVPLPPSLQDTAFMDAEEPADEDPGAITGIPGWEDEDVAAGEKIDASAWDMDDFDLPGDTEVVDEPQEKGLTVTM